MKTKVDDVVPELGNHGHKARRVKVFSQKAYALVKDTVQDSGLPLKRLKDKKYDPLCDRIHEKL